MPLNKRNITYLRSPKKNIPKQQQRPCQIDCNKKFTTIVYFSRACRSFALLPLQAGLAQGQQRLNKI